MTTCTTTWKKGQSGNPRGRPAGTGRIDEYRALLDPHVPELLAVLVDKAQAGDLAALRLILDRVYPVREGALADLMTDIDQLRAMIAARKAPEHGRGTGNPRRAIHQGGTP